MHQLPRYPESISYANRDRLHDHRAAIIWLTGLSGSGKSTLANAVAKKIHQSGNPVYVLDGDNVRRGLCRDLGFSLADRHENIRRISEVAKLFLDAGIIVLVATISPLREDRQRARAIVPEGGFFEVYCHSPLAVCEARDVKGLYRRARKGKIPEFTGISSPYEEPDNPELTLDTAEKTIDSCVADILQLLKQQDILEIEETLCATPLTT